MRFEAELLRPVQGGKGGSELEHYQGLLQREGLSAVARDQILERLTGPPMPDALWYLWVWYTELAPARGEGFSGPAPLSYSDVLAWAQMHQRAPLPFEIQALFTIDAVMRTASRPLKKD